MVQDGQGGSQAAAGWLAVYRCRCRVGRWYQIKIRWMARLRVVTRSTACRQKRRTAAAPGQAQLRKSDRQSLAREGGGRCCTGSRNLELAVLSSWAGCLGRVAALLRHDRAERAAIEWHRRRRKWWGLEARRARSVVGGKRWCNCDGKVVSSHAHVTRGETGEQQWQ